MFGHVLDQAAQPLGILGVSNCCVNVFNVNNVLEVFVELELHVLEDLSLPSAADRFTFRAGFVGEATLLDSRQPSEK